MRLATHEQITPTNNNTAMAVTIVSASNMVLFLAVLT